MDFTKLEALGNDFIIVDAADLPDGAEPGRIAVRMCERHMGAGADGLILLSPGTDAGCDAAMRIFNADGGEAEVSGNGTRCVAACLDAAGRWPAGETSLRVGTGAGVKTIARAGSGVYTMEMGRPSFVPADVPFAGPDAGSESVDVQLGVDGETWIVTVSTVGNPHCTFFVKAFDDMDWRRLGARVERHPAFPQRVNVEFVRVIDDRTLEARFWERGVGETLASGTGSTAAAAAAIRSGRTGRDVTVRLDAGSVRVSWPDDGSAISLTGPATMVYRGVWLGTFD